jgi:hypothetical protein
MERQLLHSAFLITHNYFPMKKGLYSVGQSLNAGRATQRRRLFSFANYFTILFTFALLGDPSVLRAQSCCTTNIFGDPSFEATTTLDEKFPNTTVTTTNNSNTTTSTEWGFSDGTNSNGLIFIKDATRASNGSQFIYLKTFATSRDNRCTNKFLTHVAKGSYTCALNTYTDGRRYVISYDFVPFNPLFPAGGASAGASAPRFEYNFPAYAVLYDINGNNLSQDGATVTTNYQPAVAWADVKTSWRRAYGVTPALTTTNSNQEFDVSHAQNGTSGMLFDNVKFELLNITNAGLGTISCGASGTTRIFTLNPVSNVGGTPNIKYNVTAPSGYTIAPTQGIYGQTTTFTLTKITGSAVGTGNLTVAVTDEINTNCTVNATVTDISCPCTINITTNVTGCFDSNGNTPGGTSQATVQAIVDWQFNPSGETINVTCTGATAQSINPATSLKPAVLNFTVPANGSAVTVKATFSTTTACTATQNVTAPTACILTPCVAGNTGGTVWKDFNGDGIKDATTELQGLGGVTITAYDCNGAAVATTTTDYLGQYTFSTLTPSATNKYRIEFTSIPPQYKPTFNGVNGRTDVQFISAASCMVNYGVNDPADYCQTNPEIIVPCYGVGAYNGTKSGVSGQSRTLHSGESRYAIGSP